MISKQFLTKFHSNLIAALKARGYMVAGDAESSFAAAFHEAALDTVLSNMETVLSGTDVGKVAKAVLASTPISPPKSKITAGSPEAKERGRQAAETRRRNAAAKQQGAGANGGVSTGSATATSGGDPDVLKRIEDASTSIGAGVPGGDVA